jgi:Ca-activated chloride channel family protein
VQTRHSTRVLALVLATVALWSAGPAPGPGALTIPAAPIAFAQSHDNRGPQTVYRSGIDLVSLDVCVRSRDGRFVPALAPGDFLVLENDKPQRLAFFLPQDRVPLSVMLVLDRSASMAGERLERARQAAIAFVKQLRPEDRIGVMAFNELAERRLPLTSDRAAAERAIAGVTAEGQTGLFEAVLVGLRELERDRRERAGDARDVLLVLTDGEDTSSRPTFEHVLEDVRRSGVLVYGISLRTDARDRCLAPSRELLQFAHDTGGRAVAVQDLANLTPVYEEIAIELRSLYRIGYVPRDAGPDGGWRRVSVRVAGGDVVARTRSGYYAPAARYRAAHARGLKHD